MRIAPGLPFACLLATTTVACNSASDSGPWTIDAGALKLAVSQAPWRMTFYDGDGNELLSEYTAGNGGPVGSLGFFPGPPAAGSGGIAALPPLDAGEPAAPPHRSRGWMRDLEIVESSVDSDGEWMATLAAGASGRHVRVRARAESDGVIAITASASGDVQALSIAFDAPFEDERFVGFGERGNAVDQAGNTVENYVAEGPYRDEEYSIISAVVPAWGVRWRRDTTYFPMPWLLSSRGYGVLLDNDEMSFHRIRADDAEAWSMEVESDEMRFRVFAGPGPADVLRRLTDALGRQPRDYAPWFFGPWVQSDTDDRIDELRASDVPTSVTATFTHYLPCGSQRGREESQRQRVAVRNARGTAVHTYFNPMICVDYVPEFDVAEEAGALIHTASGETYRYEYFTSRSFEVSQFDFATVDGVEAYKTLTDEALAHGYEGWMEDFGEYTPLDAVSADGATGTAFHNRYARDYHCGVAAATADAAKPLARFARSGWTGSAACTPIVWGGDPTTDFGFDGLESSIYQALSMGTSGVGVWGSDIGGFFAFAPRSLSDELLDRWIAFGALSVVMRSQKDGLSLPSVQRPQLWDDDHRGLWRRYAKLHTQLYPYLQAALEEYYDSGMPVMRHHVLSDAGDPAATSRSDQYLFGPDLLVAPVYEQSATTRELYLPAGHWVEWWRSLDYDEGDGSFRLGEARMHSGGGDVAVDAPLEEIPIFARAGAVIAMLSPDVYTLAEHGDDASIVHMIDRDDELHVLAFPRASSAGRFYASGDYRSEERAGAWTLEIEDQRARTIYLQATLLALEEPFEPRSATIGGTPLADNQWSYDAATGVLTATYTSTGGTLRISGG